MLTALDPLRQLNFASLLFRLALAMFFGGMIGMERERKRRPAGFRTYMLVCLGATLAGIVSQYNFIMLSTTFLETAKEVGRTTDVSRIGAKVIGGIGFLGAGTVIVTGRQEVKGLTTAAGLWASACMGLAIGAGFYECVVLAFLLIFLCIRLLPPLENLMVEGPMLTALDPLRQLNFASLLFRLALAMFFGGMIGMERERKRRPAGFRTYMLVCLGATLAGIVSQYNFIMLSTTFLETAKEVGRTTDVSRIGAKVIGGIGFLGAGTVIVTGRQEVKGLTTAAGLWASACMGLAIGAGFYECVVLAFLLIFLCIRLLPPLENLMVERARNMNLYVEFSSLDDVGAIIGRIKSQGAQIYEVDIERGTEESHLRPSAVFTIRLDHAVHHAQVMAAISELENVTTIDET